MLLNDLLSCKLQMLMSAREMKITATITLCAVTLMVASCVCAMLATLEMESTAQVWIVFVCHAGVRVLLLILSDVDECQLGEDNCDLNASCNDTDGSFYCTCITGYEGNGTHCESQS